MVSLPVLRRVRKGAELTFAIQSRLPGPFLRLPAASGSPSNRMRLARPCPWPSILAVHFWVCRPPSRLTSELTPAPPSVVASFKGQN